MSELNNVTNLNTYNNTNALYSIKVPLFWASVGVSVLLAILAIIGNGIVIYVAGRKTNTGTMRYLNDAVRSLAISDFLIGLVGTPLIITYSYWGWLLLD